MDFGAKMEVQWYCPPAVGYTLASSARVIAHAPTRIIVAMGPYMRVTGPPCEIAKAIVPATPAQLSQITQLAEIVSRFDICRVASDCRFNPLSCMCSTRPFICIDSGSLWVSWILSVNFWLTSLDIGGSYYIECPVSTPAGLNGIETDDTDFLRFSGRQDALLLSVYFVWEDNDLVKRGGHYLNLRVYGRYHIPTAYQLWGEPQCYQMSRIVMIRGEVRGMCKNYPNRTKEREFLTSIPSFGANPSPKVTGPAWWLYLVVRVETKHECWSKITRKGSKREKIATSTAGSDW